MRVLFCAPPCVGLCGDGGGVLAEMRLRARSLEVHGHGVDWLDAWSEPDWSRYDVAHLFMANGESWGMGQRIRERVPLVVSPILDRTAPGLLLRASTWLDQRLPGAWTHLGRARALCEAADAVCARSTDERRRVRSGLGVRSSCRVVPCPVDDAPATAEAGRLDDLAGRPFVLFVGDAGNPRKNVRRLLAASREWEAPLVLAGPIADTATGRRVRALAAETSTATLGFLSGPEKRFAMAAASVFALPSTVEGIGLAAVEAGLCGTTVVASAVGGARDYFGDAAYYADPRSVDSIGRAVSSALQAPIDPSAVLRARAGMTSAGAALAELYGFAAAERRR